MTATELEDIFNELVSVHDNIKAEVLIAEIGENTNLASENIIVSNKSTFSRPYRRDIIEVDNISKEDRLILNLSRNGLYDYLPEGLFHGVHKDKTKQSYIVRRKEMQKEEEDARMFFAPLENEFFSQRLFSEINERKLLDDFYNLNDEFLINFWKIDSKIPKPFLLKLIKILPHCYKIAGNIELTAMSLEKILGEKITIMKHFDSNSVNDELAPISSEFELGVNTILRSDQNEILEPTLEVTIGPIREDDVNKYLEKDGILKFINIFYDYFIPMEFEVNTHIVVNSENGFTLSDEKEPIMGLSTYL